MSDITRKTINGNEYMFVNTWRSNRSGFVHETELFRNDRLIGTDKCQYYNRTWECYRYQSVMKCCVNSLMKEEKTYLESVWKATHNIKRLTALKREQMEKDFTENPPEYYAELIELYNSL